MGDVIIMDQAGLRGEGFPEGARRVGHVGTISVAPGTSDSDVYALIGSSQVAGVQAAIDAANATLTGLVTAGTTAKTGSETARDLSRAYAISDTDAPITGAASTSDRGAKFWAGIAQAASSAASTVVASISGILSTVANIPGIAWYIGDTFGQMAAWITTTGEFNAAQAHVGTLIADSVPSLTVGTFAASTGAFGSLTVTAAPTFAGGLTIGDQLHSVVTIPGLPRVWVDSYDQMALAAWSDGSIQIPALRDNAGALVYPQVAQAKSDAAAAVAAASAVAISALRQKFIASHAAYGRWHTRVMASPPTITFTNTVTPPSGFNIYNGGDTANMNVLGGYIVVSGPQYGVRTFAAGGNGTTRAGCGGCAWEFETASPSIYLDLVGQTTPFRLFIDNQLVQAAVFTTDATSPSRNYYRVDFGSSANRRVRVESDGRLGVFGFWCQTGYTISKPAVARPIIGWTGTSHSYGTGTVLPMGGYAYGACRLLGANPWNIAIGGSGLFANSSSGQLSLIARSDDLTQIPGLDLVVDENGTNDLRTAAYSSLSAIDAEYSAEQRKIMDAHFTAHPNVPWIGISPITMFTPYAASGVVDLYTLWKIRDAKQKTISEYPLAEFIDLQSPNPLFGGTATAGYAANQNGLGNDDLYRGGLDGTDGSHMTQAGHDFYAFPIYREISRVIRTIF